MRLALVYCSLTVAATEATCVFLPDSGPFGGSFEDNDIPRYIMTHEAAGCIWDKHEDPTVEHMWYRFGGLLERCRKRRQYRTKLL